MKPRLSLFLAVGLLFANRANSSDWPQFLGPTRNGVYGAADVTCTWPKDGPPVTWQKEAGHGFSGPVVAEHKLILFHRVGDQETTECLESLTGKSIWNQSYTSTYVDDFGFDDGPRATPTISEDRVYTFGANGILQCLDLANGTKIWSVDAQAQFQAPKGFFGMACSPFVEGTAVLMNLGGASGAGIVAFDKATGKVLWKGSNEPASYSSPTAATIDDRRFVFFLTGNGLLGADPLTGLVRFQYPWRSRNYASVNSATPLILGHLIFVSASYGTGAVLLQVKGTALEKVWAGDEILSNHYATSVEHDGFLYGIHGRTDPGFKPRPELRCVALKTGKIQWRDESVGPATISLVGDNLFLVTEKGELVCAAAAPDGFRLKARVQILAPEVRAYPAWADGHLYVRNKNKLVCLDLVGATKL